MTTNYIWHSNTILSEYCTPIFPKEKSVSNNIAVDQGVVSVTFRELPILTRAMNIKKTILKLYLKLACQLHHINAVQV